MDKSYVLKEIGYVPCEMEVKEKIQVAPFLEYLHYSNDSKNIRGSYFIDMLMNSSIGPEVASQLSIIEGSCKKEIFITDVVLLQQIPTSLLNGELFTIQSKAQMECHYFHQDSSYLIILIEQQDQILVYCYKK